MAKKKQPKKYESARQTIESVTSVRTWLNHGFNIAKTQKITGLHPNKKLRGATVCILGPDTWDDSRLLKGVWVCKNKKLKVRLLSLKEGVKSKKFKVGTFITLSLGQHKSTSTEFIIHPNYLKETW